VCPDRKTFQDEKHGNPRQYCMDRRSRQPTWRIAQPVNHLRRGRCLVVGWRWGMGLHDGHDRISRDLLRFLVLIIYPFSAIFACFYETQGRPCAADLVIYTSYFSQDKKKITRTLVMPIHNAATSRMVLLERTWQQAVQCPSVQERGDDVCFLGCAGQVHCNC
jgi:hypothetical protein